MINPDQARAIAHCFSMMYTHERRGRREQAELYRLAIRAVLALPDHEEKTA
jgi:hypothetical protein